jgi:hypothetical protein
MFTCRLRGRGGGIELTGRSFVLHRPVGYKPRAEFGGRCRRTRLCVFGTLGSQNPRGRKGHRGHARCADSLAETHVSLNPTVDDKNYSWYTSQTGGKSTNAVEVFAASWVRDLMVARNYADERFLTELATDGSRMTGTTDANLGFTPDAHSTHDIGMAMDLSLLHYVKKEYQTANDGKDLSAAIAAADKKYTDVSAALAKAWSNDKAFDLAELLKTLEQGEGKNKQAAALKEFFSLYSITQSKNGSLGDAAKAFVNVEDKAKAASALFKGTILKGYIGEVAKKGKNEYKAINDILKRLGLDFKPQATHADHFHITFAPPGMEEIGPKHLLAQVTDAATPSYAVRMGTSGFESGYGDVQLVQVTQDSAATAKKTVVLDTCLRTEGGEGGLVPLTHLKFYFRQLRQPVPEYITDATVVVTKQPKFGTVVSRISRYGEMKFDYVAADKNWLGRDRVEFEVTYQGKTYKIVNRIEMVRDSETSDDLSKKYYDGPCDSVVRRIAYEVPGQVASNGSKAFGFAWDDVDAMLANLQNQLDLSSVMLVFGDLPGEAVGNSDEKGANAGITLDAAAAGHVPSRLQKYPTRAAPLLT